MRRAMAVDKANLMEQIRKILMEKVLLTDDVSQVTDQTVASLDSIGRLTLMVELENAYGVELMDTEMRPEVFGSLQNLTDHVVRRLG